MNKKWNESLLSDDRQQLHPYGLSRHGKGTEMIMKLRVAEISNDTSSIQRELLAQIYVIIIRATVTDNYPKILEKVSSAKESKKASGLSKVQSFSDNLTT